MTPAQARKIGSRQALLSVAVGLVVAQLIMYMFMHNEGFLKGFFWFLDADFQLNIAIGVLIMLLCGHFFGQLAGQEILIRQKHFAWVGIKYGLATLLTTAFLGSLTGYFQTILSSSGPGEEPFHDYVIKPLYWILMFGTLPAAMVGVWFGWKIRRRE